MRHRMLGSYHSLGQTASGVTTVPELSENPVARFAAIGQRLWMGPTPLVEYGPSSVALRWSPGVQPTNVHALLEYAKITAVGTFVGIPVAALLGAYFGRRLKKNRGRR